MRAARARLAAAGVADAVREARWLAEAAAEPRAEPFERLVARRCEGEPLAYVTGVAGFRRLLLHVDRRVLIPRPETEGLVELVLGEVPEGRVADVGTGSGCVALALADEGRYAEVTATDASPGALAVARDNAFRLGLRVAFLEGDLLAPLTGRRFDAVVSNPPYLSDREYAGLDPSVRDWEPADALASGPEGMDHTRRLLAGAGALLVPDGMLALEVDERRAAGTAAQAEAAGWRQVTMHDDPFGRARYVLARAGARA
ncbi:MAG TPA: peptide chain release factor N(5)-glutamine methyltransferase [Gemmatimonadales bacterium]|nr:peptide chain release factor N(5)-glutamine methyltransferase [Gemmatimonadales bacterium]